MTTTYARIDADGELIIAPSTMSAEQLVAKGFLPYEELPKPVGDHNYSPIYVERDSKIYRDWKPYPNFERIEKLKKQLTATDYKVIKCAEAVIRGATMPYDADALHAERQAIRDEINRLERCED